MTSDDHNADSSNVEADDGEPQRPPESLRRELFAILFLYGILSVLPLLIGFATAP